MFSEQEQKMEERDLLTQLTKVIALLVFYLIIICN